MSLAVRRALRVARRTAVVLRRRVAAFPALWRSSLQVRVVVSTLALCSAVVFVLGMVLENEITNRLLAAKQQAADTQFVTSLRSASDQLRGVNPGSDDVQARLLTAWNSLTSTGGSGEAATTASASAGAFEAVLADDSLDSNTNGTVSAGPYADVPSSLRQAVLSSTQAQTQITTVPRESGAVTFLVIGDQVVGASQPMQLYLLFPLTPEQHITGVVQGTMVAGGLVLVLLLASITNLVVRQVVRPVRRAAEIAERFANGHLDERVRVVGEDDVARLAESYNQMAESIQEQINQLEEFGQLQRRFTSDVSHELRTPLTTVRMAADVLHASREQFPSGLARSTELMVDELDRFEALLGDLLEISRLDAGVEELSAEQVDVRGLARSAAASVAGIVGATTTEIELQLPEVEVTAEVDAPRVERILRNLLANAVDHGEGLPVRLTVGYDDHAVALAVRDYGVGLRAGEEELVFNRFWRADPSRNRRTGGTGLGLAISLEDARLHGGWLEAWSEHGQGACFRLTLPRRPDIELTSSPVPMPPSSLARADEPTTGFPADPDAEPGSPNGAAPPGAQPPGPTEPPADPAIHLEVR
ncbi:MAG TPA: MtrAB system histidine kinase MtrB [Pseudonocardiaceae bacterium]|jgi:two-component system sensor histidine kinase MtrB|nr:MtrAB system histidine kinase MtrB [Pseudonocardiaceae bacterium]